MKRITYKNKADEKKLIIQALEAIGNKRYCRMARFIYGNIQ